MPPSEPIINSWLLANVPGFNGVAAADRNAMMHFLLLWSLFEATALNTSASAKSILACVRKWNQEDRLQQPAFVESLQYFRDRYFPDGNPGQRFRDLNLRPNDQPELVEAVLKGENREACDSVAALFIIIYRLRNNLFHGVKWAYNMQGQLDNFTHANAVLMRAIELASAQVVLVSRSKPDRPIPKEHQ